MQDIYFLPHLQEIDQMQKIYNTSKINQDSVY